MARPAFPLPRTFTRSSGRALCVICLLAGASWPALAAESEEGFQPLFNGKDLSGWVKEGDAGFVAKDGMLVCNGSGNWPTWLRTEETFENFELKLEYRPLYGAESGVFLHAPLYGRIAHVGFDVRIGGAGGLKRHSAGAILDAMPPLVAAAHPHGDPEFNLLEVTMNWPKLKVRLNGQVVQDLNVGEHESLRYRPRIGFIGLQDRGKPVMFRNLRIKRLPDQVRDQWQSLSNGKDLKGWTVTEKCSARWTIDDGSILASNGHGYLLSDEQFKNCELETYIRSSPLANGGVFFRWLSERDRGFEVQVEDIPDSDDPTGSIYGRVRAEILPFTPGEWVLMQVFLRDKHCVVRVNGETVAESHEMPQARAGKISLQMHSGMGWVRYKDLRVRPLPDEAASQPAEAKR